MEKCEYHGDTAKLNFDIVLNNSLSLSLSNLKCLGYIKINLDKKTQKHSLEFQK